MIPMPKLSETQRITLSHASQHAARLAPLPKLPKAAAGAVLKALLDKGLLAEIVAPLDCIGLGWRQDKDGAWIDPTEGQDDIAAQAPETDPVATEPPASRRLPTVRDAAHRLLAAWDDDRTDRADLSATVEALRDALARKPGRPMREPGSPPRPREGTKLMAVLAMLRRQEGATVAQVGEATGWGKDTVRGFFAGLKKRGITVEVAERIRQVGPNRAGSRGSYTVYRVAGA
ncbi:MAG: DUF3489 domain-containing protein [Rhodospirillales bacterium]|nr:DUF3489 domain-containing protein [Rhodospirillales bacterium]